MVVLVTGGSASGKSEYAENLLLALHQNRLVYIATMFPYDEESHKRIARHQEMRKDKKFDTVECYTELKKLNFADRPAVLLECMSNLVANEMYHDGGAKERTVSEIMAGLKQLKEQAEHLVIVTNEVFSDGNDYDMFTKEYLQNIGNINCSAGRLADVVVEVVYGNPLILKGKEQLEKFYV